MSENSIAANDKNAILVLKAFFNIFTIIFLCFSLWSLWEYCSEKQTWSDAERNGVCVTATIVDVITELESSDDNSRAFFQYTIDGKKYIYEYKNYPDGLIVGKQVTAYVYPDNPEELIISTAGTNLFFFWFMLGLAVVSTTPGWILIFRKNEANSPSAF